MSHDWRPINGGKPMACVRCGAHFVPDASRSPPAPDLLVNQNGFAGALLLSGGGTMECEEYLVRQVMGS